MTKLYDQDRLGSDTLTNGDIAATNVRVSCVFCFTNQSYQETFAGRGTIGGGGQSRWVIVNPPENHDYDKRDWERLPSAEINKVRDALIQLIVEIREASNPFTLTEEPEAAKIRLAVKEKIKAAGKIGKRLMDHFVREQVCQAVAFINRKPGEPFVMTAAQARYIAQWVEAQLECRVENWPADASNQVEGMESAIRKCIDRCRVPESEVKRQCHVFRPGSGGNWTFAAAMRNALQSGDVKVTALTRKQRPAFCPRGCRHTAVPYKP